MPLGSFSRQPVPRALPPDAIGSFELDEFGSWASVGRTTIYEEAKAGRLIVSKIGRKSIVTFANARAWLNALPVRQVA
jgi:hypothetical protein